MPIILSKSMQKYPWRGSQDGSCNCKIKPQNKTLAVFSQNTLNKINCHLISKLDKCGAVESKLHGSNCHLTLNLANFGRAMAQRWTMEKQKRRGAPYSSASGQPQVTTANPWLAARLPACPSEKLQLTQSPLACTPRAQTEEGERILHCPEWQLLTKLAWPPALDHWVRKHTTGLSRLNGATDCCTSFAVKRLRCVEPKEKKNSAILPLSHRETHFFKFIVYLYLLQIFHRIKE